MTRLSGTSALVRALALTAFAAFAGAAQAGTNEAYAAVDTTGIVDTHTDGTAATASVAGAGAAFAEVTTTLLHITASDSAHYALGSPTSGGTNDSFFQVLGGAGPVTLKFHFKTLGHYILGDPNTFVEQGGFYAFVQSATGPTPAVSGGFNIVNCVGCGGRLGGGTITQYQDYYGPGSIVSFPWDGFNPGSFTLTSTFATNTPFAGRLQMGINGAVSQSSYDFALFLKSVTGTGAISGMRLAFVSGEEFAVSAVPEPATWAVFGAGFFGLGMAMRHRRHAPRRQAR